VPGSHLLQSELVTLCGRQGRLEPVGETVAKATTAETLLTPLGADCWVWRTDRELLRGPEGPACGSLLNLACDVAELYHQRRALQLSDVPGAALEVIWLELAADESLLVFLKPVSKTVSAWLEPNAD